MDVRAPTLNVLGPFAEHDQACAVCHVRHAVYDVTTGVFEPCWTCQERGWRIVRRVPAMRKLRACLV